VQFCRAAAEYTQLTAQFRGLVHPSNGLGQTIDIVLLDNNLLDDTGNFHMIGRDHRFTKRHCLNQHRREPFGNARALSTAGQAKDIAGTVYRFEGIPA